MTPEWLKVDEHGWPVRVKRTPYDDYGNRAGERNYDRPTAFNDCPAATYADLSAYNIGYLAGRARKPWRPYPKKRGNADPIGYFQSYTKGYKAGLKTVKGH